MPLSKLTSQAIKNRCYTCNWDYVSGPIGDANKFCKAPHCYTCGQVHLYCKCCKGCQQIPEQCECEPAVPKPGMPSGGKAFGPKAKLEWDVEWIQSTNKKDFEKIWQTQYESLDLCEIASDFYLLQGLKADIPNPTPRLLGHTAPHDNMYVKEADYMLQSLVARVDQPLQNYIDMAIGGELRYTTAAQPILSSHRRSAWITWKKIREKYGAPALLRANELFCQMNSGSYGGPKWGNACVVLHHRVTGKITPEHWVDVCMNLQHNGGCFFNKIEYGFKNRQYWGLAELQNVILPEHGREPMPDWVTLLKCASDDVRTLFQDYWKEANYHRIRAHLPAQLVPREPAPVIYKPKKSLNSWNIDYKAKLDAKKAALIEKKKNQAVYKKHIEFFSKKSNQVSASLVSWAADYIINDAYDSTCGCPGCSKVNKVYKQWKAELLYLLKSLGYKHAFLGPEIKISPVTEYQGVTIIDDPVHTPVQPGEKVSFSTTDSVITELAGVADPELEKLLKEEEAIQFKKWSLQQDMKTAALWALHVKQEQAASQYKVFKEDLYDSLMDQSPEKKSSAGYLTAAQFEDLQKAKKIKSAWVPLPKFQSDQPEATAQITPQMLKEAMEKIEKQGYQPQVAVSKEIADALKELGKKEPKDLDSWDDPF